MPAVAKINNILVYKGSNFLRQRLVLSILSGKAIRVVEIRTLSDEPGLKEFEVSLIRLLDKITNGTTVELNETGTALFFQPGLLHGGKIEHDCGLQRSLGYYLEALLMLGLFCKEPLDATLRGVTSNSIDPSVDHVKISMISTVKKFIYEDEDLEMKILKRGMPPSGGGEVNLKCPVRKQLRPVQLLDIGMVKRIRGMAYALRVSPAIANRMVDKAKGVLLNFIPDVYINTDHCKGKASGKSPGFGMNLHAETNNGIFYTAESVSETRSARDGEEAAHSIPEDIGTAAAHRLLEEIYLGGYTDSTSQSLAVLCMALGQKDVSKIILGPLSDYTVGFLQNIYEFFNVTFKIERHELEGSDDSNKILLTCVGIGYTNLSKRTI